MRSGARAAALLAAAALAAFPMAGCSQEGSVGSGEEREDVSDEFGYVPEWFEEDARVEPFSKRALTEKLFVCMNWLEMLIETEYDQALEEGRGGLSEAARPAGGLRSDGQGAGSRRLRR